MDINGLEEGSRKKDGRHDSKCHDEIGNRKRNDEEVNIDCRGGKQTRDENKMEGELRVVLLNILERAGGRRASAQDKWNRPMSDEVRKKKPDEQDRRAQFDQRIAHRDARSAIGALRSKKHPTENRNVLIPANWGITDGTMRGRPRER